jgi:hypothetical protein
MDDVRRTAAEMSEPPPAQLPHLCLAARMDEPASSDEPLQHAAESAPSEARADASSASAPGASDAQEPAALAPESSVSMVRESAPSLAE